MSAGLCLLVLGVAVILICRLLRNLNDRVTELERAEAKRPVPPQRDSHG